MDSHLIEKWNKCLEIIRDNVSEANYATWFADIKPIRYEDSVLTIQVKSNYVCEHLDENYLGKLICLFTCYEISSVFLHFRYELICDI